MIVNIQCPPPSFITPLFMFVDGVFEEEGKGVN